MNTLRSISAWGSLLFSASSLWAQSAAQIPPNILIILCDDMGYGDLGCYGQPYIQTPHIDRLASEGIRFTQAYAGSPVSAPSRATLMTGQHTGHTHVRGNREYWPDAPLVNYGVNQDYAVVGQEPYDPNQPILPEVMKRQGYTTGLFGKWAGGYEGSPSTPDKRGVDEFYGYICQYQAHLYYPNFLNRFSRSRGDKGVVRVPLKENIKHPMYGEGYTRRTQYAADLIHGQAMQWLDRQNKHRPFFGLLTYTLPHAELAQPEDSLLLGYKKQFFEDKTWGGNRRARYNPVTHTHAQFAAMISRLDCYVGQIMAKLKQKGLDENTLVIFTSDNGPHEEGGADPEFFGRDGALRGLKRSCYEGGIRIPFIVRWPGHVPAGMVSDHLLAFYDLLPTCRDLVGDVQNDSRRDATVDGLSFLPTLLGHAERQVQHDFLYWEFHETDQMAVRCGDWKLYVEGGIPHLYNLSENIHEDHDLSALYPDTVRQMIDILYREHRDHPLFPVTLPEQEPYFEREVEFPVGATIEQKVDLASRVVPSASQLAWQQMELTAFLHFGINTFTGQEWGDGTDDPSLFNPLAFDANQWVKLLKETGFKMVILTAKHHDGFCLWPTETTHYSVSASPWRDGRGDVVKEVHQACERYGLKFGIYLSPWDRNASCYGDSPRYNDFFIQQLTELLTRYGRIDEVWFDGACAEGPNGKKQEYDWEAYYHTVHTLQPEALTAVMGEDIRWVGNEEGMGRLTEWSTTVLSPGIAPHSLAKRQALGIDGMAKDLGSREMLRRAQSAYWFPSEVDVSIRPGWFWRASENNQVKTAVQLAEIYLQSVGRNSSLLLNIPPDNRGLIHEADAEALRRFAQWQQRTFNKNLVQRGEDSLICLRRGEQCEFSLDDEAEVGYLMFQEDIRHGQRIEAMKVELLTENGWKEVGPLTTIGYKRILILPPTPAKRLRITLLQTRRPAYLKMVAAFRPDIDDSL